MFHHNDPWIDLRSWFFAGEEQLETVESLDGTTLADQVDQNAEEIRAWAEEEYRPDQSIALNPLLVLDIVALESCLRRLMDDTADAPLLVNVWKAAADCSVNADGEAALWRRGELVLTLWEFERANAGFDGSGLYTRLLDAELGHFDWEALKEMPPILFDQLVSAREGWMITKAADEEAQKHQPTLFELDEQP